jgi:NAD+ synthase
MKIAIAQVRGQIDDPPANASKAKMLVNNTDVDLLIFPEMFATGYDMNCARHAKDMDLLFMDKFNRVIQNKGCSALFGSITPGDGRPYNSAILTDGKDRQVYHKIHLDVNEKFSEKDVFTPGPGPKIFEFRDLKIGMAIGRDIMFGELFRWYSANGANIVICISAVSGEVSEMYDRVMPARCIENSMGMIFVNMVGPDPGYILAGGSKYISSQGAVLESCSDSSDVRIFKLDIDRIKESKGKGVLKDVRKDIDWSV